MSFGDGDCDEFLTIKLQTLIQHKSQLEQYSFISNIVPVLSSYELQAGFVFKLSVIPIAYDVSIGEHYPEGSMQHNEYCLLDHLSIDPKILDGTETLAFTAADHKRITNLLTK